MLFLTNIYKGEHMLTNPQKSTNTNQHLDQATYKQAWAVAYHFAEANKHNYPAISEEVLARRFWASMLNYYDEVGSFLSSSEVSLYLDDTLECPKPVIDRIIYNEELN